MEGCSNEGRLNSFAVVQYLPEPLASFVDGVRREIAPQCRARAHITVLPPRPLICDPGIAWEELRKRLNGTPAFEVQLEEVNLFRNSEVIYISVGTGCKELEDLHRKLNQQPCDGR